MSNNQQWQDFLDGLTGESLSNGFFHEFSSSETDEERLRILLSNKNISKKVERWLSENISVNTHKDSKVAFNYKEKANKAYSRHCDKEAICLYGEALLACPRADVSIIYGNRSAVLFASKLYKVCISDIDCALFENFPSDKQWKIYKRKGEALRYLEQHSEALICFEKCKSLLTENQSNELLGIEKLIFSVKNLKTRPVENLNSAVQLYRGSNPCVPSASCALEVSCTNDEGRFMLATEDIPEGSVVTIEKPYAAVLLPDWYMTHCQKCFAKIEFLHPCYGCSKVVFCSIKCRGQAIFHAYECNRLELMAKIGIAHLSMRIILVTPPSKLLELAISSNEKNNSKQIAGFDSKGRYVTSYKSVYHLLPHSEKFQAEDLLQYSIAGLLLFNMLKKVDYFPSDASTDDQLIIGSLLLRHIQQLVCNAHAITTLHETPSTATGVIEQEQVRIATAIYPTTSLLNHSCEPTIVSTFDRDRLVVKLAKGIKKGDRVYNCYGPHYKHTPYAERQKALKMQYFFTCRCEHCLQEDNSETSHEFSPLSKENNQLFMKGMQILSLSSSGTSIKKALNCFIKSGELLEKSLASANGFNQELSRIYDVIAKCYAMLNEFTKGLEYLRKSVEMIRFHYGSQSLEYTNELLKLTDVYFNAVNSELKKTGTSVDRKTLQSFLKGVEECIKLTKLNKASGCEDLEDLQMKKDVAMSLLLKI